MTISMDKEYTTRDGRPVRILCTNRKCDFPIVALVTQGNQSEDVFCYTQKGSYSAAYIHRHNLDLIEKPRRLQGWINVYPNEITGVVYQTRSDADSGASDERIACIDLSQFKEGEGL